MDSSALASSIAALRSSIRSLEIRSDSLEAWLYLWVTLVVLGVALEVGFVLWEHHDEMEEFRRGIIHPPHRPSARKLLVELLAASLVAIGVGGELAVDVLGGSVQTSLRAKNGDLIRLLEDVSSATLQRAADAETRTLREIKAREALNEQVLEQGPRNLMLYGERADRLVDELSQFRGQKVQVRRCVFFDNEVLDTASRFTELLNVAKWSVAPGSPNWGENNCLIGNPIATGIWAGIPNEHPDEVTKQRAAKLLGFIKAVPLEAESHSIMPMSLLDRRREPRDPLGPRVEERYENPDAIVIVFLAHAFNRKRVPSGGGFVSPFGPGF